MIKISILQNQPEIDTSKVAFIFLTTGMSEQESDYYAEQISDGAGFEIDAPDNDLVNEMIDSLKALGVRLDSATNTHE